MLWVKYLWPHSTVKDMYEVVMLSNTSNLFCCFFLFFFFNTLISTIQRTVIQFYLKLPGERQVKYFQL